METSIDDKQFKHLEELVLKLDEVDKSRYLYYIASQIFKNDSQIKVDDMLMIGDTVQKVEVICAKVKKIILETEVSGACCKKCNKEIPKMLIKHHLAGVNKECPHNEIELINDEEYQKELNKESVVKN